MFLRWKTADIYPNLRQNHQGSVDLDAIDQRQVDAQGLEQGLRDMETHVVALASAPPRPGLELLVRRTVGQPRQFFRNSLIAFRDLLVVKLIQVKRLLQSEQMLRPPRALQRLGVLLLGFFTTWVPQTSQLLGVTLPLENCPNDPRTGHPHDIRGDLGQLDVHLLQGLLDVLDVAGSVTHLHLPLPPVTTQSQHRLRRPKRRPQQTIRVQPLQPLTIRHIRLGPSTAVSRLRWLDQGYLETTAFQQLEQRNPVNTRRFQHHRRHTMLLEVLGNSTGKSTV